MSVDSKFVHKVWHEQEISKMVTDKEIFFPMLSDPGGRIGELYGVYDEEGGVDVRGLFLIDPDGVVVSYEILTPPVGRNVAETLRQIDAFQLVRKTAGAEACPSGWKAGKATLKPGPQLVSNVWKEWTVTEAFE